jgi:xanthine dehydrogenase accessory factor
VSTGTRIWIQGAGELASGVAWRLTRCGYRVVAAEIAAPVSVRRLVCFSEAVRAGRMKVEGVAGRLAEPSAATWSEGVVVVCVDPGGKQMARLKPDAVVDARMTKRRPDPLPRGAIPSVGLGPGFRSGRDADLVVETHRGARLGAVIDDGTAAPHTGLPGAVGGATAGRVLRAPCAGKLLSKLQIGDLVNEGAEIGRVSGQIIRAAVGGMLRGLIHPEVELHAGMKVGDIDPRGDAIDPRLVSDKALAVAGGVLEGLLRLGLAPRVQGPGN